MEVKAIVAVMFIAVVLSTDAASISLQSKLAKHLKLQNPQPEQQNALKLPALEDYNPFLPDTNSGTDSDTTCKPSNIYHCHGCFYSSGMCCCPNSLQT